MGDGIFGINLGEVLWGKKVGNGLTACTDAPSESELSGCTVPKYGLTEGPNPSSNYNIDDPDRPEVVWRIKDVKNCDGTTAGLTIVADFGSEGTVVAELVEEEDGTTTAVIRHRFSTTAISEIPVTITSADGEEVELRIYPPFFSTPDCAANTKPSILGNIERTPEDVVEGEPVTFSIPAGLIYACDGATAEEATNRFDVTFVIDNEYYPAQYQDGSYFYDYPGFETDGNKTITVMVEDIDYPGSISWISLNIYVTDVTDTEDACNSVPEMGAYDRSPDIATMPKGSDTYFTWFVGDLTDCNGDPLIMTSDNTAAMLTGATVAYDENTLTVSGQLLPTVDGGTLRVEFTDTYGNPKVVNLYLPTIDPVDVTTSTPFIQQEAEATFIASDVSGAISYRFWVTKPDGTDSPISDQFDPTYTYTPDQSGAHTLYLEIETYDGVVQLPVEYDFVASEAHGEAEDVCYVIPEPGAYDRVPDNATTLQGADTLYTWTQADLTDCNGDPLFLVSDNTVDMLEGAAIDYDDATATLTVSGQILPSVNGGTVRVDFEDIYGNPVIVNLFLPTVDAVEANTSSLFIQQSVEASFIASEVSGAANYRFWVTRPDDSDDVESNQVSENYAYTPNQAGAHTLNVEITTYNGETLSASYDFIASEAPGEVEDVCFAIPEGGLYDRDPDNASMAQGSDTAFTWTQSGLTDCNGDPLVLVTDNTADILEGAVVDYDDETATLTVTGQVLPSVNGGTIQVALQDGDLNTRIVNLFLPTLTNIEIDTVTLFIQEEAAANFIASEVAGADCYHFWITRPDGTSDGDTNQADSNYLYTPNQSGLHTLNLEVTSYNGDTVSASYPFVASEAGAGAPACYAIPEPGLVDRSPYIPSIVKGDNTEFTWTVNDLTDCVGESLSLHSHTADDVLYDESITYDNGTQALTTSGRVLSTVAGGSSIQTTFLDDSGNTKIINLALPSITDPDISIVDPYITVSENLTLQLLSQPNGAGYRYYITRPDGSVYDSGNLASSLHSVAADDKSQTGAYIIDLQITAGDGETFSVPDSFVVHEDGD